VSGIKLEYYDGNIYAMAGGTLAHAELATQVIAVLRQKLSPQCRVFSSDAKVLVEATGLSTFPDVSVVCGERRVSPIDVQALTNPTLLVEVTSKSTEDYDRSEKLNHYQQLSSLEAVLFVSHRQPRITLISKGESGWNEREIFAGGKVQLKIPDLSFELDEVYRGVQLDPA
jgi:Uma2 family endonuclease